MAAENVDEFAVLAASRRRVSGLKKVLGSLVATKKQIPPLRCGMTTRKNAKARSPPRCGMAAREAKADPPAARKDDNKKTDAKARSPPRCGMAARGKQILPLRGRMTTRKTDANRSANCRITTREAKRGFPSGMTTKEAGSAAARKDNNKKNGCKSFGQLQDYDKKSETRIPFGNDNKEGLLSI